MYTREILTPRGSPIENGTPLPGTWNRAFSHVNLLDIHRPYQLPLPRWLKDYRIKEWEGFSIQDDRFFLDAILCNFKLYNVAWITLYDKENREGFVFRKFMPGGGWKLPRSLAHGSVECRSSRFLFRVHTWLNADTIKMDLDIAATRKQPAFTSHLAFCMENHDVTPAVVSLNFTDKRNMYAYKALAPVRGDIVLGGKHFSLNQTECTGIFRDYKGFFPYRMKGVFCGGIGFDGEGRRFGFHIAENQARETRKNNENALWVNECFTPLPPVRITMSDSPESKWVIQDVDGMVDLVFTPEEINQFRSNLFVTRAEYFGSVGHYNGILINENGEQIQVKNLRGIGKNVFLRM